VVESVSINTYRLLQLVKLVYEKRQAWWRCTGRLSISCSNKDQ